MTRIVSEIDSCNQICNMSCSSKVISTELCNNWEICVLFDVLIVLSLLLNSESVFLIAAIHFLDNPDCL